MLPVFRSEELDESETLRRALGTVQQLLEKQCGNYNPTLDGVVDKELMKSNSSESKFETNSGVRKTEETDKLERKEDRRKSPAVKPRIFDGSTSVEAFLQQFSTCAQYYNWKEEESSVQMKCALSGDAATLVWSQTNPEQLTVEKLQELLRERYGSAKQEEKFQAELCACRQKAMKNCQL